MANNLDISKRVIELIAEQLHKPVSEITPSSKLEELGADSLDRVEMIMKLEDEFQVEIKDEEAERFVTVDDLIAYITHNKQGA